jgi:uncharacterized protein (TIGR03437 family)
VNWATTLPGPFAPNMIATLYGTDLAFGTEAMSAEDTQKNQNRLPTELANVQVLLGITRVPLLYVSPGLINFLLPDSLVAGDYQLRVVRQGTAGAQVNVSLQDAAPSLCLNPEDAGAALGAHGDGTPLSPDHPARPGEFVVLYAAGLGRTVASFEDGQLAPTTLGVAPITIKRLDELRVLLDGEVLDAARVLYAGLAPGTAGVYQLNLRLPDGLPPDPEIRLALGDQMSPAGVKLRAQPADDPQLSSPPARLKQ